MTTNAISRRVGRVFEAHHVSYKTRPLMLTRTPKSDTKPTAAEMLKLVPVRYKAQMPPTATSKTLLKITRVSKNERNAE